MGVTLRTVAGRLREIGSGLTHYAAELEQLQDLIEAAGRDREALQGGAAGGGMGDAAIVNFDGADGVAILTGDLVEIDKAYWTAVGRTRLGGLPIPPTVEQAETPPGLAAGEKQKSIARACPICAAPSGTAHDPECANLGVPPDKWPGVRRREISNPPACHICGRRVATRLQYDAIDPGSSVRGRGFCFAAAAPEDDDATRDCRKVKEMGDKLAKVVPTTSAIEDNPRLAAALAGTEDDRGRGMTVAEWAAYRDARRAESRAATERAKQERISQNDRGHGLEQAEPGNTQ